VVPFQSAARSLFSLPFPPNDIFAGRALDQTIWELPSGHALERGVMPLFVRLEDHYAPCGTAFVIGKSGLVATAAHW